MAGLYLRWLKCDFEILRISLVGFIVMPEGVEMEPDLVCVITEWPEITCYRNIQVFLSFTNFYRCFNSSFLHLAKLMTDKLKTGNNGCSSGLFLPTPAMKRSFAKLCGAHTKAPMLAHFNPAKPICLETDASEFAIAGIIS